MSLPSTPFTTSNSALAIRGVFEGRSTDHLEQLRPISASEHEALLSELEIARKRELEALRSLVMRDQELMELRERVAKAESRVVGVARAGEEGVQGGTSKTALELELVEVIQNGKDEEGENESESQLETALDDLNLNGDKDLASLDHKLCADALREFIQEIENVHFWANQRQSCLAWACQKGHVAIIQLLLARGSDINGYLPMLSGDQGRPIHFAIESGSIKAVDYIISKGANVNTGQHDIESPLLMATSEGSTEIVQTLLNNGSQVDGPSEWGYIDTPLLRAVTKGYYETSAVLLDHGANVEGGNASGRTPLRAAAFRGSLELVRLLIQSYCSR